MIKNKLKNVATMSLSAFLICSMLASPIHALETDTTNSNVIEETKVTREVSQTYPEGVSVVKDEESPSGYTAHFIYDANADSRVNVPEGESITGVEIHGSFRLFSEESVPSDHTEHGLDTYKNGDFLANVQPHNPGRGGEWTFDLELNKTSGKYELSVPMISGSHYYYYIVKFSNGETFQIDDPKNVSPCRENEENSDSNTGDITHSIVYGKWDPVKQSRTPNLDYTTPYEGENKGTLTYVEYKGTLNNHQDLGIYLPAGYDAHREEPYKVIYLSHGAGGNETYWFSQPQATNIMDYMIAENPDQEAIVVGLDNTLYSWNYYQIGQNVVNYVIPYMEANYNVSKDPQDRAFAGFSMGAMTTTYMAFHHADQFGYFGIFSGCNIGNATFKDGFEYDSAKLRGEDGDAYLKEVYENIEPSQDLLNSVVFTMAGDYDTAVHANGFGLYGAYETIRDWCAQYMPEENFVDGGLVHGSHDIYTWGQCLYTFAKDVCWSKTSATDTPVTPEQPEQPTTPEQPEKDSGTNQATAEKKPTATSSVKTGDDTELMAYATALGLSAMIAMTTVFTRKKKNDKN